MNCNDCGGFLPRCDCSPFGGRLSREIPAPVQPTPKTVGERAYDHAMELALLWGKEEYARGRSGHAPSDHNPTLSKLAAALSPLRGASVPQEDAHPSTGGMPREQVR